MIRTQSLIKQYGGTTVLNLPGLIIEKGQSFGLVGNNGAGKTTFFSLILDLIEATSGEVQSDGQSVKQSEHWKRYTGSYLDERFLIDFLTPEEYFDFVRRVYGVNASEYNEFLEQFEEFFQGEILGKKNISEICRKAIRRRSGLLLH